MRVDKFILLVVMFVVTLMLISCAGVPSLNTKYDQVVRTVVRITIPSGGTGSGVVIVSHNGKIRILTGYHVVVDEMLLRAEINGTTYTATLLRSDQEKDLALLEVLGVTEFVAHVHAFSLQVFSPIIMVGAGNGRPVFPSMGIVANLKQEGYIQLDGAMTYGKSGGGLFTLHNDHYVLVGILLALDTQTISMTIPVVDRLRFLPLSLPIDNVGFAASMKRIMEFLKNGV